MWPFTSDDRLRKRLKALETRCDDLEHALSRVAAAANAHAVAIRTELDATNEALHKLRGVVYGRKGAEVSAAKTVPTNGVDKMDKNALRALVGLRPGKAAPQIEPQQTDIEE